MKKMERETNNKKRGREEQETMEMEMEMEMEKGSRKRPTSEISEISRKSEDGIDSFKPLSVFDFPWQQDFISSFHKEDQEQEWKDSDLFFPSPLSPFSDHAMEFNGGGIGAPSMAPLDVDESWPSIGDDIDGVDCIWSSVLNQPLFVESLDPQK